MKKEFNIECNCIPEENYMVDISNKLDEIAAMIEKKKYFTINRARQFGKTTTLDLLRRKLEDRYLVISINFEGTDDKYSKTSSEFVSAFVEQVSEYMYSCNINNELINVWNTTGNDKQPFASLSKKITELCKASKKEVILLIDEVDKSSNNEFFVELLGLFRNMYIKRRTTKILTFKSIILAGVYDIKNLKLKIRKENDSKHNSPWNVAADFDVDMSFSADEIKNMLDDYENDNHIGFNTEEISNIIYDYTSGYPFLVSKICKVIDEKVCKENNFKSKKEAWSQKGIVRAIKIILLSQNLLFDDIDKKLEDNKELEKTVKNILIKGKEYSYVGGKQDYRLGLMFGILAVKEEKMIISNRIFETYLYDKFIAEENDAFADTISSSEKEQFVKNGALDMELILKKFQEHFIQYYKDECDKNDQKFIENNGRFLFLTFIRPIINGTGNFYVEARTRNDRRTDLIIDYNAKQYIIELKIWHGDEYNKRGEQQLFDYLTYYNAEKGYLVSFNFNKNKECTYKEIVYNGKNIVEVVI